MAGTEPPPGYAAIQQLLQSGEAGGSQAQFNILLQILTQMLLALQGGGGTNSNPYFVYDWTGGDLVIATQYPNAKAGTFVLKPVSPGPLTVTMPNTGGPWLIVDGSGFCSPTNQITIAATGGTIRGATDYYFVQPWQSGIFVNDSGNYNIF